MQDQHFDETNDDSDENRYTNHYHHEACGATWQDTWSCSCDDDCPNCGVPLSPYRSVHNATGEVTEWGGVCER